MQNESSDLNKGVRAFETIVDNAPETLDDADALTDESQASVILSTSSPKVRRSLTPEESQQRVDELSNNSFDADGEQPQDYVTTKKMYFYRTPQIQSRMAKVRFLFVY